MGMRIELDGKQAPGHLGHLGSPGSPVQGFQSVSKCFQLKAILTEAIGLPISNTQLQQFGLRPEKQLLLLRSLHMGDHLAAQEKNQDSL